MGKNLSKIKDNLPFIYMGAIASIFILVLFNFPPLFSPSAFPKALFFRIIFSSLLLLLAYDVFFKKNASVFRKTIKKIRAEKKPFFYIPLVLLSFLTISLFFSVDLNFSIFGDPSRGGGFLNFFLLILFSYFLFFVLNKENWKTVWNIIFFTGVVATFIAFLQWQELFDGLIVAQTRRPYASFGNPTIFGTYLSILVFPLTAFLLKEKDKTKRIFYSASLFIIIFGVLLTYTRAAILGIIVGAVYFMLFLPRKEKVFRFLKVGFLSFFLVSSLGLYYVNTAPLPSFVENNDFLHGLAGRMEVQRALEDPRIGGFIIGWNAIMEKPLTGYGAENFSYAFDRNYHPDTPFIDRDIPWWDKAHNLPIEIGTWGGFPALISLLLIFISLFLALRKKTAENALENHAMQATLITFFVANFFTVDDFAIYLLFAAIIGYIFTLCIKEKETSIADELSKREKLSKYKYPFLVISIPLLIFFISNYNLKLLGANRNINIAEAHQKGGNCDSALAFAQKAGEEENPITSYLLIEKSSIIEGCMETEDTAGIARGEAREKIFLSTKEAIKKRPTYVRIWSNLGIDAINLIPYKDNKEELLDISIKAFSKEIEISPNRFPSYKRLAFSLIKKEDFQNALNSAKRCLALKDEGACFFLKGVALSMIGEEKEPYFAKAREKEYDIVHGLNNIMTYPIYTKNYESLIPFYLMLLEEEPEEAQHHASIAVAYKRIGDYEKAREHTLKSIKLRPESAPAADDFLESLPE